MKSMVKRVVTRLHGSESGFTLIEMLIVVGIIVALAAASVPQVVQFGGRGEDAQKTSEQEAIQVAIDAMLAETLAGGVAVTGANAVNDWTAYPKNPTGQTKVVVLSPTYFRNASSTYYYCWDADGIITKQVILSAVTNAC